MKTLLRISTILLLSASSFTSFAQVNAYPFVESFESPFVFGTNVNFIPYWWGSYVGYDTMGQFMGTAKDGSHSLFMNPEGEEFEARAQVYLDLSGDSNTFAEFWVATKKVGSPEDQKKLKLRLSISIDSGLTFPYTTSIGSHQGFPNANTPFEKYSFSFPKITDNQANVVFRFASKSGGGPHLPGKLLIDSVVVMQAASDIFPPYVLGTELVLKALDSFSVVMSEPLLPDSALDLSNYIFGWPVEEDGTPIIGNGPLPGLDSVGLSENNTVLTFWLDPPMSVGETYSFTMLNLTDLNGNTADTLMFEELVYNMPKPGSIVISEVMFADPSGASPMNKLQFVELFNPTLEVVPLGGLRIKGAIAAHNLPNVQLQPGEYWVATRNAEAFQQTFGFPAWEWKGSWIEFEAEEGEILETQLLYIQTTDNHGGELVDSVALDFTDSNWISMIQGGKSVEVCNNFANNEDVSNWSVTTDSSALHTYVYSGYSYNIYATPGTGCDPEYEMMVDLGPDGYYCGLTSLELDAGHSGSKYLWSTGDSTQNITITASGTYYVLVNNGITAVYDTISVEFVPACEAIMVANQDTACMKYELNFSDNTPDAVAWYWDFGDGNTSNEQHVQHSYQQAGMYQVQMVAINSYGCSDTVYDSIYVDTNNAGIIVPTPPLCQSSEIQFTNNSAFAQSLQWYFGDGNSSNLEDPLHIYAQPGNHQVQLIVSNTFGCVDSVSTTIYLDSNDAAMLVPVSTLCQKALIPFTDLSINGIQWLWDMGDGQLYTDASPSHVYTTSGSFLVELEVLNAAGCVDTVSTTIEIAANDAAFVVSGPPLCQDIPLELSDLSSGPVSWFWHFGDGGSSSVQHPEYTFTSAGDFPIKLIVETDAGCIDSVTEMVTISPNEAGWKLPSSPLCQYSPLAFFDNSISPQSWLWDFGNGYTSTDEAPIYTFDMDGEHFMQLTVFNTYGCIDSISEIIEIYQNEVDFKFPDEQVCKDVPIAFEDLSNGTVSWYWDFGGLGTSLLQHPEFTFTDTGSFTVTLIATNYYECTNIAQAEVVVDQCVGIEEIPAGLAHLNVYPNPSRGNFMIELRSETGVIQGIRLINLRGDEIWNAGMKQATSTYLGEVNLTAPAKGLYLLQINTSEGMINRHLIVQ